MGITHFEWLFGATHVVERLALLVLVAGNSRFPARSLSYWNDA